MPQEKTRVSVNLDAETYEALRLRAFATRSTHQDICEAAIIAALKQAGKTEDKE